MKIFITGSKGFIGRELVLQCQKQGMEVLQADLPEADICSKDIANLIPEGVDAVIHLAALSRDADCKNKAPECFNINVMGTLNLMRVAEEKKVKQFIFASSEWVYDNCNANEIKNEESLINIANHKSEYALSKLVSEANLRQKYQNGFCPVTILRFGIVYGQRKDNWSAVESLFNSVKTQDEIKIGSLKTGRCFIYVSDIASGIIKSIGLDGFDIINLEGDKLITLGDIIGESKKIFDKNLKITETDPDNQSVRNISNEKAKKILKWNPEINLEAGLKLLLLYGK
ncbi:MAG: NAD(P)-dependent oxidoreductase [Candidatus Staskawiczbacteria bacterium]|jgi:nucleoside-diphosphate-sugar epimerase